MAKILTLALALGLVGCAASPPPDPVVVTQIVYVDRSPPPVVKGKRPYKKQRFERFRRHPVKYAHDRRPLLRKFPRAKDTAQR